VHAVLYYENKDKEGSLIELEKSKQAEEAATVYQEALEIFPGYRHGPTVVIDVE
jgi:hypothetical protein